MVEARVHVAVSLRTPMRFLQQGRYQVSSHPPARHRVHRARNAVARCVGVHQTVLPVPEVEATVPARAGVIAAALAEDQDTGCDERLLALASGAELDRVGIARVRPGLDLVSAEQRHDVLRLHAAAQQVSVSPVTVAACSAIDVAVAGTRRRPAVSTAARYPLHGACGAAASAAVAGEAAAVLRDGSVYVLDTQHAPVRVARPVGSSGSEHRVAFMHHRCVLVRASPLVGAAVIDTRQAPRPRVAAFTSSPAHALAVVPASGSACVAVAADHAFHVWDIRYPRTPCLSWHRPQDEPPAPLLAAAVPGDLLIAGWHGADTSLLLPWRGTLAHPAPPRAVSAAASDWLAGLSVVPGSGDAVACAARAVHTAAALVPGTMQHFAALDHDDNPHASYWAPFAASPRGAGGVVAVTWPPAAATTPVAVLHMSPDASIYGIEVDVAPAHSAGASQSLHAASDTAVCRRQLGASVVAHPWPKRPASRIQLAAGAVRALRAARAETPVQELQELQRLDQHAREVMLQLAAPTSLHVLRHTVTPAVSIASLRAWLTARHASISMVRPGIYRAAAAAEGVLPRDLEPRGVTLRTQWDRSIAARQPDCARDAGEVSGHAQQSEKRVGRQHVGQVRAGSRRLVGPQSRGAVVVASVADAVTPIRPVAAQPVLSGTKRMREASADMMGPGRPQRRRRRRQGF